MYHNVAVPPKGARIPNLYVTPRMFRFQMWYLKTAGFKVLPLQDLVSSAQADRSEGNVVAITFDDGFKDFYDHAYPVLKQYGYPSTVYVVSGLVGMSSQWDLKKENHQKKLMDWDHIIEVSRNGVLIGSHTATHPHLSTLSGEALKDEVTGSKKTLEERLGLPINHFCYPYGDYNDQVKDAVIQAGYRSAVVTLRGHVTTGCDTFALRRIPIKLTTNPFSFLTRIHTNSEKRKGRQKK